ncbi:hypothetical protein LO80_00140 [Candidatus Francisella endociliophora]|uniref:histone deacetylase n=1 Tax=Candidatus Francisella endociliophora TaxID=653937 RepID=A0A097ELT9_9GAMM|nr:hypothetical protein [Francisella sp. FSC1006]AIT08535.1 hypothetical protein LO80_00140 [Francisella sp. FSC1006]
MSKINFFHNFDLFKKHINFEGSNEQPKRLDIVKLAFDKAKSLDIIEPHILDTDGFNNEFKSHIGVLHPQQHIDEVKNSSKFEAASLPLKALNETLCKSIQDGQISFYAMRPPGHHSFAGGISKDDEFDGGYQVGEGYCYFNNVAFASFLAYKHFDKKSILIIDWDYHHGNGTQNVFFDAKHDYIAAKFKDFDIYFISLHNASIYPYYNEIPNSDPQNFGTISGKANNSNSFIKNIHFKRKDFLDEIYLPKFYQSIDEAFDKFTPDLVLISAGFDARSGDPIAKFEDGEGLSDSAYYKMSKYIKSKLISTNNTCPIISLLEGGYNVSKDGFSKAVLEHLKGLAED